jgi:hypothetical protein
VTLCSGVQVCLWRADLLCGVVQLDADARLVPEGTNPDEQLDPLANTRFLHLLLGLPSACLAPGAHISSILPPLVGRPPSDLFTMGLGGVGVTAAGTGVVHAPAGALKGKGACVMRCCCSGACGNQC